MWPTGWRIHKSNMFGLIFYLLAIDIGVYETVVVRMSHDLGLDRRITAIVALHEITSSIVVGGVALIVNNHRGAPAAIVVLVLIVGWG